MSPYVLYSVFVVIFGLFITGESKLPITSCKRDSDNYSACLKRYLEETWPQLIKGYPEINFPSLDPLYYKYGIIVFNSGEINAEVILSDTTATGLSRANFYDVRTHFLDNNFRLEIDVLVPQIIIEGEVKLNGTLGGIFRIADKAHFNVTADDVKATWDLTGRVVNDTWTVEHVRVLPTIKKLKVYFDDLFHGNKQFNDLAIIFVNEFWPALYRVMLPLTSNVWDPWLTGIVNNIFLNIPFSELFP
ncbi:hypothetical protein PUN28_020084 [Cardiocondyla obscurior]|uniref:Circadian clock-controlled protein n=1 Tax=Cardiocondyla obscurior TaxID=286306 RepID=A0AAW2E8G5_9HYME